MADFIKKAQYDLGLERLIGVPETEEEKEALQTGIANGKGWCQGCLSQIGARC